MRKLFGIMVIAMSLAWFSSCSSRGSPTSGVTDCSNEGSRQGQTNYIISFNFHDSDDGTDAVGDLTAWTY